MSTRDKRGGRRRAVARIGGTAIAAAAAAAVGAGTAVPAFASQVPGAIRGPALTITGAAPAVVVIRDPSPTGSGPNLTRPPAVAPATVILTGTGSGDGPGPK
jgi:hypothetical protein